MQSAERRVQSVGTALRLYCLPLTREVAKSLILTEGEISKIKLTLDYLSLSLAYARQLPRQREPKKIQLKRVRQIQICITVLVNRNLYKFNINNYEKTSIIFTKYMI